MNQKQVQILLQHGFSPRQIAKDYGYSRKEVEAFAAQLFAHRRAAWRKQVFWLLLALIVFGGGSYLVRQALREPTDLEIHSNVLKVAKAMPSQGGEANSWFIQSEQGPKTTPEFLAEITLIDKLTARLNKALAGNSDIPEVAALKDLFGVHLVPTMFQGGITRYVGTEPNMQDAFKPGMLEVVFFGRESFNHPIINRRLLHYEPGMKALMIAALKFTDEKWYDAMIAHEAWHAKLHREGAASATALMLTDSWVEEELQAHEVERKVLHARTSGEYGRRLDTVVSRIRAKTFSRFLVRVKPTDMISLDQLFSPGIPEETDIRSAQYLLDLGLLWAQKHFTGTELLQKRMEIYRFLISPQSTNVR